ncbi:hypothetical protein QUC31_014324, partial [Theobroma cacao]
MGLLPCHLSCYRDDESQSRSNHLHSESSNSSISSQSSLPSVPSLTPVSQHDQTPTIHHKCIATLKGHSYVFSLALARKVLYSGSSNGEIQAWSQDFSEQDNPADNIVAISNTAAKSLVVLRDKLFSAHQDNKIRIWKIHNHLKQKYKCIATLPTLNDHLLRCFSKKNYVQVRRHRKSMWVHHVDTVSALAISIDCSLLYSALWDRTFKVWRTSDFKCLESVQNAHDDAMNAIVLSKDGFVYTGSADKTFKVGALRGRTKAILCLAVVMDLTCSGSADETVRIWRRGTDKSYSCLAVLEGHRRPVKCLTAAVDGKLKLQVLLNLVLLTWFAVGVWTMILRSGKYGLQFSDLFLFPLLCDFI